LLSVLESVQPVHFLLEKAAEEIGSRVREVSATAGVVFRPMCRTRTFACCAPPGHAPREVYEDARRSTEKIGAPARGH